MVQPPLGPPPHAPATSQSAIFALVLGISAYFLCVLGPIAAVAAIALGILAQREIKRSRGVVGGGAYGTAGIALGVFNLVLSAAMVLVLFLRAGSSPPPTTPPPIATWAPPSAPKGPSPRGAPGAVDPDEGGQMTTVNEVTEVRTGKVTLVDVPPTVKSLATELEAQRSKARAAGEKVVLFTITDSCRPCMSIAAVLPDPKMQAALAGVRLVRIDVHDVRGELEDLGVQTAKIPGFYLLGPELSPTDGVTGAEWDDDTADNAGPVLAAFVRGTYPPAKRKERFVPLPRRPRSARPAPTMLLIGDRLRAGATKRRRPRDSIARPSLDTAWAVTCPSPRSSSAIRRGGRRS